MTQVITEKLTVTYQNGETKQEASYEQPIGVTTPMLEWLVFEALPSIGFRQVKDLDFNRED